MTTSILLTVSAPTGDQRAKAVAIVHEVLASHGIDILPSQRAVADMLHFQRMAPSPQLTTILLDVNIPGETAPTQVLTKDGTTLEEHKQNQKAGLIGCGIIIGGILLFMLLLTLASYFQSHQ